VILTSHSSPTDSNLLATLAGTGIEKFIAHEIPLDLARARYAHHFETVATDLREADDLRVLDHSGHRAFSPFSFHEPGPVIERDDGRVATRPL
jgi:hypothetical protein